jgi:hypothetical protein
MILPMPPAIRQAFAQGRGSVLIAFAMYAFLRNCFSVGLTHRSFGLPCPSCYPSPSLRSGPSQAGPVPLRRGRTGFGRRTRNRFEIRDIPVEFGTITTNQRGSTKCGSRLSSLLFFPRRWPAACRTLHRAGLRVPLAAHSSRMRLTKTCWPVPPLAAWPVLPPAESSSACRPAALATDLTACGRAGTDFRTIRAARPGGPFNLRA